jgi:hypothetical protein
MHEHATILPPPPSRALALRAMLTASYVRFKADAKRRWEAAKTSLRALSRAEWEDDPCDAEVSSEDLATRRRSSLGQRPVRFLPGRVENEDARPTRVDREERATVVEGRRK